MSVAERGSFKNWAAQSECFEGNCWRIEEALMWNFTHAVTSNDG